MDLDGKVMFKGQISECVQPGAARLYRYTTYTNNFHETWWKDAVWVRRDQRKACS